MNEVLGAGVALVVCGTIVAEAVRRWREPEPGTVEYVHHLYRTDAIDEREMERRLAVVVDPEAERIREATERVSGIAEKTSWSIASRFDTLDDVREADLDELQAVPNVGDKRAQNLRDEL